MLYVKIVDNKNEVTEVDELTDVGVTMAIHDCRDLIEQLEDKHRELMDDEDDE